MEYVFAGLLVVAVGTLLYREFSPPGGEAEVAGVLPNSIAVLPFENLSLDPEDAFFAAGIHDELLNQLAKIRDLSVIARTTVLRYEGSDLTLPEIASELNVETVMEGTVRYADGSVRITTQLNDGVTGLHIWSETYTRPFENIFEIETDIATAIAMALEAELLPSEQESIERIPTDSPQAYALYLRAAAIPITPGTSLELAGEIHEYLDRALAIDPNFARAHALKASEYATSLYRNLPLSEELGYVEREQLARAHAEQALMIDSDEGFAYAVIAKLHARSRNGTQARLAFNKALSLSPNSHQVLQDFTIFHWLSGQYEDSLRLAERAVELGAGRGLLGRTYLFAGDYDAAAVQFRIIRDSDPTDFFGGHWFLGIIEVIRGNNSEALSHFRLSEQFILSSLDSHVKLVYGYGRIGQVEAAERQFTRVQEVAREYHLGPGDWAMAYLGLRDYEQALVWLNRDAESNEYTGDPIDLFRIAANVYDDPILDQPEFVEVRSRLGFRE